MTAPRALISLAILGILAREAFALISFGVAAVYAVTVPDIFEAEALSDRDGFNRRRNTFTQTLKGRTVDAALLLLPEFGVVEYDDPRMVGTVEAVQSDLVKDGLVRRYTTQDSLDGTEGAFLPCSFWLAECLARQGRVGEATEMFDAALAAANDAGLFSEEFDARHEQALGNFPQALTHLSHISAAVALTDAAP